MDLEAICAKTERLIAPLIPIRRQASGGSRTVKLHTASPFLLPMPDSTHLRDSDPATVALYEVAARVDSLTEAWKGDDIPPDLAQFLPAKPLALRRLVLGELIKVDLEYRWLHHELPKQVEEYVEEFPEVAPDGNIPCDLIYEEFHIRGQSEQPIAVEDYCRRFPQQADRLRRMMCIENDQMGSTTLVSGQRDSNNLDVGQQIDDFDLLVKLGKGSFGSVFLARQRSMQRLVALKISRDRGVEPQTLAQLDHPHIVRVYDQRVLADKKLQLMYMQHIPGGTLQETLAEASDKAPQLRTGKIVLDSIDKSLDRHGDSPPTESGTRRRLAAASWPEVVCWIGSKLAAALEYAHQRGVLHRDIKPANVLLAADGSPKLVDFNVSFSSKLEGATPAAYFGGSLIYMSPEQIEAYNPDHSRAPDELDGRSDVYSLGIMLWELLTCSRPFDTGQLEDCIGDTPKLLTRLAKQRHAGLTPTAIAKLPPDLPSGLQAVLTSCLASDVNDRPVNAGVMGRQLELCLQPSVQRLLRPAATSWRQRIRSHPFLSFVLIGLLPSVILSVLNFQFNTDNIAPKGGAPLDFFKKVQVPVVNGVLFPIAIFLVYRFAWSMLVTVGRTHQGKPIDANRLPTLRRRSLWIGDFAGWLGMALWVISGIAFPAWQHWRFGATADAGLLGYWNFLASQIACGWISSTLTFFMMTLMSVRAFYPVLVRPEQSHADEVGDLIGLERRSGRCFILTFLAPLFAVILLASVQGDAARYWMVGLAAIGALCSVGAFFMLQAIRGDLAALALAIDPQHDAGSLGSDTVTSSWSGTR